MPGSKAIAARLYAANVQTDDDYCVVTATIPEGFTYLDSGAYRHCFVGPDGVVYKIVYDSEGDFHKPNLEEWEEYNSIRPYLNGIVQFPETSYFPEYDIIAMEYIVGDPVQNYSVIRRVNYVGHQFSKDDWCGGNVITKNGIAYVVDFAV